MMPKKVEESSPPASTAVPLSGAKAAIVFVGIFLAILMGGMDALIVSTALPTIATDLHQVDGITFVVAGYLIASTVSIPIFARLSDSHDRRNVFVAGLVIFIAGSALAGQSQNLGELIAFRAVQGFGIGGLFPVAIAMVAVLFPASNRARVTAALAGAAGISIVIGPLLGSYILDITTWRWVFYVNLPIGLAGILVMLLAVRPLRPLETLRFDVLGAGTLSAWVGALMFALVQVSDAGWAWSDPRVIGLLGVAGVLLAVFLWWELRTTDPLVPLRLLKQRVLGAGSGASAFMGVVFTATMTFLSIFVGLIMLHDGPNASNDVRDMIYFFAVPMILGAVLSAPLLGRVPYRVLLVPGLALGTISCIFLTDLSASMPLWVLAYGFLPVGGLILPLIPMGLGSGLALGGITIAVQSEAPQREVGAAVGLVRFFQSLGGAVGLSLLTAYQTWRFQALSASATTPLSVQAAEVTSYNDVFIGLTVLIGAALVFAFLFRGRLPHIQTERSTAPSRSEPQRAEVEPISAEIGSLSPPTTVRR